MGHGNFYVFTIENSNLKLSLKTPAVDYNPDIRWSPDNLKNTDMGSAVRLYAAASFHII